MKKNTLALFLIGTALFTVFGNTITAAAAPASCAPEFTNTNVTALSDDDDFGGDLAVFQKDQTIEETVLYDENDVRITATGITYGNYEAELGIRIENNSSKKLQFTAETLGYSCNAVNGFMIENGYLRMELEAGESGEDSVGFGYGELLLHGITQIADIQVGFDIQDEDHNDIYTGPLQVKTSAADSYDYDNDGYQKAINSKAMQYTYGYTVEDFATEEVFNSGGVRILSECCMTNQDGEHSLFLEVKNDNDFTVYFTTENITINGIAAYEYTWSSDTINPSCRAVVDLNADYILDEEERAELGIDEIESIGFTVNVVNDDGIVVAEPKAVVINV